MKSFPERGDSLTIELARGDLERKTSERYKGFVVRSRLRRVLNEDVKSNAIAREEEVRRFPGRYIDSVKSPWTWLDRSTSAKVGSYLDNIC